MKISKMTAAGFLICLIGLYLMNSLWLKDGVLEVLPVLGVYVFPAGVLTVLLGLFKKDGPQA